MAVLLSEEVRQLLDRPNFAHLATLMPDGSPQSVPVWVGREGERIVILYGGNLTQSQEYAARATSGTVDRGF